MGPFLLRGFINWISYCPHIQMMQKEVAVTEETQVSQISPCRVRPAEPADAESLVRMSQELTQFERDLHPDNEHKVCELTVADFEKYCFCKNPVFRVLVATEGGNPVGYATFSIGFDSESAKLGILLTDLYVSSSVRGAGIGTALFNALVQWGADNDATWITWSVNSHNSDAKRLYDRISKADMDLIYWSELSDLDSKLVQ
jgi:GNAT superfamily N-acetyltransferase